MPSRKLTGAQIRQDFVDYFAKHGHSIVPSSSLVPGGDQTLLFTNAGMVQFKDIFLGTDRRQYTRAVNSQKCMRVAGKHNDLDDVGRDNTHHTFFEMLGNWSFGDYYKPEAIAWAWELLTGVWGLPKEVLYATCFEDEKGVIPRDDEAADIWRTQPGFDPTHVLFFGRKENLWEMAETGPCGPCSEIHIDRGIEYCNMQEIPGHTCQVNGECARFLELWNLVFIQYNRTSPTDLQPLPAMHVDTGMGFERIVSVLQDVDSNYKTDLLLPLLETAQELSGQSDEEVEANLTSYRVIADHARAAAFLIADGVVPGNTSRNYVCRMIIRRASRFGAKIGLNEPFLADVASVVIHTYGDSYPELVRNRDTILANLTREEERFHRTLEAGSSRLEESLAKLAAAGSSVLPGDQAFDLYATYGLPLEITRDIAREQNMQVDEAGFLAAMDEHRLASGAGEALGSAGEAFGSELDGSSVYQELFHKLRQEGKLEDDGVLYDPYDVIEDETEVLAIVKDNEAVKSAAAGDRVELILPRTAFYVESGGQVSDIGTIRSVLAPVWEVQVTGMHKPAAGVIVHRGRVVSGEPRSGDQAIARVDTQRRKDIMRNHTATHLLHAELQAVLGAHARQAGSLVAPDRLRFDFTHPQALTSEQLERIEMGVNLRILGDYALKITYKDQQEALKDGATALFGEKYGNIVRTIRIGEPETFSYELCGGTHVEETGDIGLFLITSEGSTAAGIRRIEAVTGRGAYELVRNRSRVLKQSTLILSAAQDEVVGKIENLLSELEQSRKNNASLRNQLAEAELNQRFENPELVSGVPVLAVRLEGSAPGETGASDTANTLRQLADRFRQRHSSGVVVLAAVSEDGRPLLIAAITDDLVQRGLHAGELVKHVAQPLGGGGGGKPNLAQAGGKDAARLDEALASVPTWVSERLPAPNQ